MMAEVKFENNAFKVIGEINEAVEIWLEEASGEIESEAKINTKVGLVDGGRTKSSWQHVVFPKRHEAFIGNKLERSIWLEFGTGDYALEGKGRKGGWYIPIGEGSNQISQKTVDAYGFKVVVGKKGKKYAFTTGIKPQRVLHNAVESKKKQIQQRLYQLLREKGD